MTFTTAFSIGERVKIGPQGKTKGATFTVSQIRIQTLDNGKLILTEYRPTYRTGRNGAWQPEAWLVAVKPKSLD